MFSNRQGYFQFSVRRYGCSHFIQEEDKTKGKRAKAEAQAGKTGTEAGIRVRIL